MPISPLQFTQSHSDDSSNQGLPTRSDDTPSRLNVVVSGYYGFNNLGDELILATIAQQLQRRGIDVTVISNEPENTAQYYGVKAVGRTQWGQLMKTLSTADLLISGGGGLLQDTTGLNSVLYYGGLIHLAKFFELPVLCLGQGIGPLKRKSAQWFAKTALNRCDAITVRDDASAVLLENLINKPATVTADPVWLMDLSSNAARDTSSYFTIGVSLRPWSTLTAERLNNLAQALKAQAHHSPKPTQFYLFSFQDNQDVPVLERLQELLACVPDSHCHLFTQQRVLSYLPDCHRFYGMRFHSILLATVAQVPTFGLIYDPKVKQLLNLLQIQGIDVGALENLHHQDLTHYFEHYQQPDIEYWRHKAYRNFEVLDEVLNLTPLALF